MSDFQTTKLRIKLRRLAIITFGWMIIGGLIAVHNHLMGQTDMFQPTESYYFPRNLMINLLGGLLGGLIGGTILIFFMKDRFRKKSFVFVIMVNTIVFLSIIFIISLVLSLVFNSSYMDLPIWHTDVIANVKEYLFGAGLFQTILTWFIIVSVTSFVLQVNDKFGIGNLRDHIFGKYHTPKEETRIFMFLDLRSSTTIAETLGHVAYFNLLNDFYRDITDPIIYSKGEIYQYVGDEIVVSWKMENGIEDANCLKCFYEIKKKIIELSPVYRAKYGLIPEFKAGQHFGVVTTGEIGVVKKDVIFTGDVLNTTSRIQELCNKYGVDIMTSYSLLDLLPIEGRFHFDEIGEIILRGKKKKVRLCAISKNKEKVLNVTSELIQ